MSLYQGLLGAQVELAALPPQARLRRAAAIARLFASELAGTVALAPYAARALSLYRKLPAPADARDNVTLDRAVRYGPAPRAVVDVYSPATTPSSTPCVVFVHGGVWAAGESWHYAPLCAALARLGILTYCVTYSLYPDVTLPEPVAEVASALSFAMDDAPKRGGDPSRVALVGHSAGAHLALMALLYKAAAAAGVRAGTAAAARDAKAKAAELDGGWSVVAAAAASSDQQQQQRAAKEGEEEVEEEDDEEDTTTTLVDELLLHPAIRDDARMPALFVGAAGMYDAAKHFHFERLRGVHELSTLKRAMGGCERFAAMSPAAILGLAATTAARADRASSSSRVFTDPLDATQYYDPAHPGTPWLLAGEAVAHRFGLDREAPGYARRDAQLTAGLALAGMRDVLAFPVPEASCLLPPSVLMHAAWDTTVPLDESTEMHRRLLDAGAERGSKVLLYRGKGVGHASFVLDWPVSAGNKRWLSVPSGHEKQEEEEAEEEKEEEDGDDWASRAAGWGSDDQQQQQQQQEDGEWWDLLAELPPHCRDLALIVTGRAQIDFCRPASKEEKREASAASAAMTGARAS
jgi:acetyl esterase/lipase